MNQLVAWLYEDSLREAANARGENCWHWYTGEILDELGASSAALPFSALRDGRALADCRVLIIGDCDVSALPSSAARVLRKWVEGGGTLVAFRTTGMDDLFGIAEAATEVEAEPFTVAGWMPLAGRDEASGLLSPLLPVTPAPIMSGFRRIAAKDAVCLTEISTTPEEPGPAYPAITRRNLGKGRAFYLAFNLPQAVWTYHQGRPITRDVDGDGYLRTSDAIIVDREDTLTVPCADLMLLVLENIVAGAGIPLVHQLPPLDGGVPDALFHIGGDDESGEGLQAKMSHFMKSLGMPYHVNVMLGRDGKFHFTDEDRKVYEANGHEFSLHFDFMSHPQGVKHPAPVEEAEFDRQLRLFIQRYGKLPICANTHCLRASGWADTARFGARRGIKGENSMIHHKVPPMDPTNLFGTPFGTVYPFFVYDDAAHGNERLDFVSLPIGFYEPGAFAYEQTHPLFGKETFRPEEYRRVADLACEYGWTLDLFMHPGHLHSEKGRGRDALRCMLDRVAENGARAVRFGTDALTLWWHARSRTRIERRPEGDGFTVETAHGDGVLVRFLEEALPRDPIFTLDGKKVNVERRQRRGRTWLYVHAGEGRHGLRADKT